MTEPNDVDSSEIVKYFGEQINKPELLASVTKISKDFSISVEEVFINWESFDINRNKNGKSVYTVDSLLDLQSFIQQNIEKKSSNSATNSVKSNKKININLNLNNLLPVTPLIKKSKSISNASASKSNLNSSPLQLSSPLNASPSANNSGSVIESLNSANLNISESFKPDLDDDNPVKVFANFDAKKYKFRTMRTKLLETADILDDQIDQFIKIYSSYLNITSFNNPSIVSQNEITTIGRIVPDSPTTQTDQQLNAQSLSLETSRSIGIGSRIQLDLSGLSSYSLFPGQIVALRGKNPNGDSFKVSEIIEPPLLGAPISPLDELSTQTDMKIIITSGPYTTSHNLDFQILGNLVDKINNQIHPHTVIMFGPFVDITHPLVQSGELADLPAKVNTLDEVFIKVVSPILKRINNKVNVILIPSLKDSVSKHASYPQDSFDRKYLNLGKNFKCFPNPSIFQLNEALIGVSNNDIFKDLKDVVAGDASQVNRFDRIANYIIQQRKFYPLFPGSIRSRKRKSSSLEAVVSSELNIPYSGLTEFGSVIPDILILPSDLKFFAKVIKNVLIINPSNFMKPGGLGTFVQLSINKAVPEDLTQVDGMYLHDVWKRSRVDIIKS